MAPWDGSNNYQYPPGTPGVPDTTIESNKYNAFIDDLVVNDLNRPRPISRGGTGATDAATARSNLKAQVVQQVVTNYDAQVWEDGSFYSAAGATGAPTANAFTGTAVCYGADPTNNITLEAFDVTTGKQFKRVKTAGAWGGWVEVTIANYVLKSGDTMSGNLSIAKASPTLILDKSATTQIVSIVGLNNTLTRWQLILGDDAAESGAGAGSNFGLYRYTDAGTVVMPAALSINRASGTVSIPGSTAISGSLNVTGNIQIANNGPNILLNKAASGQNNSIYGSMADKARWIIQLGDATAESGSSAGSNFGIIRVADDGVGILGTSFAINRATGAMSLAGAITVTGNLVTVGAASMLAVTSRDGSRQYTFYDTAGGGLTLDVTGTGTVWSIASTTGTVTQIGDIIINKNQPTLMLNANPATQGIINFLKSGATRWQFGKQTDDTLFIYDAVNGLLPITLDHNIQRFTIGYPNLRLVSGSGSAVFEIMGNSGGNAAIIMYSNGGVGWNLYNRGADNVLIFSDSDASAGVYMVQNATGWTSLSDARLKSELEPISVSERMRRAEMQFGEFTWKKSGRRDIGYTAQDFYRAFPEWVHPGVDGEPAEKVGDLGVWGVMESKAGLAALAYADELRQRIEALEEKTLS